MFRPTTPADLNFVLFAERQTNFVLHWERDQHLAVLNDPDIGHWIFEQDGEPVGYVILNDLQSPHRSVTLRRIAVATPGHGYGRMALREVKRIIFEEMGMHRLALDVMASNTRALHLYRTEGFVEEGIWRDALLIDGAWVSLVFMAILEGEYGGG